MDLFQTLTQIRKRTTTAPIDNGKTALLDGIYAALQHLKNPTNPRKALLVISSAPPRTGHS